MVKIADFIVSFIADLGIKHVFLLPGGQAMHLVDSLGKNKQVQHVCALHEQAAAMMAVAYSRATDNFGVAMVTTGPGGTNAVTGVASAWLDSIPCMFISGQFRLENTIGDQQIRQTCLQGTDPIEIVKSITKYAVMIKDPKMVKYHLEKAVFLAKEGRPGPVWLDVPLDIQSALVNEEDLISFDEDKLKTQPDRNLLIQQTAKCVAMLKEARRPVILAGNGIRLAHAVEEFTQLAEQLGIPVLTTFNAMDLIGNDHPLYMGRPNYWGQRAANFIIQNSDVLLSIGSGLDISLTGFNYKAFAREAKKIIVDIDEGELKKNNIKPDVPINFDAKDFIKELLTQTENFQNTNVEEWVSICRKWNSEYPVVLQQYRDEKHFVHPFVFIDILSDELAADDIIIPGNAGTHFTTSVQAFKVKKGQRIISHVGIGAMGHSLPSSIGVCLANNKQRTICLTGDGGIQLNIQELQTIINYDLPIKIFIFNNGGYLSIKNTQKNYFNKNYVGCNKDSGLGLPDMIKIAQAYGFKTHRIVNHCELRDKIREVLNEQGAVVCEVVMSPEQTLEPKLASKMGSDGKMVASPLEDLYPFLDRKEFMSHMFIKPWSE
ncbi:MAG: acetolactate synthase large subunit [Clostridia bacterium]|nr:acetolactate synthase large subunit [Clostridia bacterium]